MKEQVGLFPIMITIDLVKERGLGFFVCGDQFLQNNSALKSPSVLHMKTMADLCSM